MPRRSIETEMWSDPRFDDLTAHAKLVFIRLTTGPDTTSCGAVRFAPKRVAVDCGMSREDTQQAVDELSEAGLVRAFADGWLWLPNWMKHQVHGPSFIGAARRAAKPLPDSLRRAVGREIDRLFPRGKAVDNSSDDPDPDEGRWTDDGHTQDNPRTGNVGTSWDEWVPTPRGSTEGRGEEPPHPPVTGSGGSTSTSNRTSTRTDLRSVSPGMGHDAAIDAPSSSSAGPTPALNRDGDDGLAAVLDLAMAKTELTPEPDPARERERRELAEEIERRRREREQVGA